MKNKNKKTFDYKAIIRVFRNNKYSAIKKKYN